MPSRIDSADRSTIAGSPDPSPTPKPTVVGSPNLSPTSKTTVARSPNPSPTSKTTVAGSPYPSPTPKSTPKPCQPSTTLRKLAPAPPRARTATPLPPPPRTQKTSFYDLPAELRIEIYKLAIASVSIHVLPLDRATVYSTWKRPHALCRTSRQVRHEVLPLIHARCPITAQVTNFEFDGLLTWMNCIPPDDQRHLLRNERLRVHMSCSPDPPRGNQDSLRKWLHMRADIHRPQPHWTYSGPRPSSKIETDLRRRVKRMRNEMGKREELLRIMEALGVRQ